MALTANVFYLLPPPKKKQIDLKTRKQYVHFYKTNKLKTKAKAKNTSQVWTLYFCCFSRGQRTAMVLFPVTIELILSLTVNVCKGM